MLLEYLKEKETKLKEVLPELRELAKSLSEDISVEVYLGVEGFKSLLNDRLKISGPLYGLGIDEELFEKRFPIVMHQYVKKAGEKNLPEYLLTSEKTRFMYPEKHMHYRYIPEEFFVPTATAIYGDRIAFIIWEPLTTILIKNAGLAESYKRYHKMLWKLAKEKK